jgi:acyl carrier protein
MTVPPQRSGAATPAHPADHYDDARGALAAIWAELLDLDAATLPTDVSFLRLGGDSVLAVRMSALVRKRLGVALALSDVRVEITLADLTDLVRRRALANTPTAALPVQLRRRPDPGAPFPLLPLQQGYFVGQHDGWELSYDSAHYYVDIGLNTMDGDEAVEALGDALNRLATHQPTLRARVTTDGQQYVLPPSDPGAAPKLRVHDLRTATDGEVTAALAAVRQEMSTIGPDPRHGPGMDFRLSLLPDGRGRLHTAMSLLLVDGWSSSVLNRELLTLASDWNAALPPLEVDFGDYVTSLAQLRRSEAWAADQEWWWARLDHAPQPPALPLRADPQQVRPIVMAHREARLPAERWAALRDLCAQHGVTPSTALLTAFAIVLARWAGHRRLLLNSLQFNRLPLHPDVHRVVGAFASTMLLPVELATAATFAQLAGSMQHEFSEHAAHNLVSGVEVARELGRRRGTHRPAGPVVFQSTLGMDAAMGEKAPEYAGPLGVVELDGYHHQLRTPQVALEMRLFELDDQLVIILSLVEELFEPDQVDAAFTELVTLVGGLAERSGWDQEIGVPAIEEPPSGAGLRLGQWQHQRAPREAGPLRDQLEQQIAEIWEDLLDVPVLDRGADFFALGGDSLLAVRSLAQLARTAQLGVSVRDFLENPTVAGLAAAARPRTSVPQ